jgi:hypothetical protein
MGNIRAATTAEALNATGDWAFVDLGFAQSAKSCGLLIGDDAPSELTFGQLTGELVELCRRPGPPLNLLLEAPLSVAFGANGNPTGRSIERRGKEHRYWYVGLGCSVLVAATYALRAILEGGPLREVRLVEGLASFKPPGVASSHVADVLALRDLVRGKKPTKGRIVSPEELAMSPNDVVTSAFKVSGMDLGVPPVVALGA